MTENKKRTVTITLTQSCNLACTYCYEHHKSTKTIDFEVAKRIIDQEFDRVHTSSIEEFEFDLFGGEPFLEFDLLKKITEYICSKKESTPCTVFATTNGTLVHGPVQDWLKDHACCFVCGLSLDGTREMHNVNRSNSYDDIDLAFFATQYPQQDVKMTISRDTLPNLADGVIDMHNKGFLVSCNLAYEIDWSDPDNMVVLERELHKLIDYYLANSHITPCSMLDADICNVVADNNQTLRYCGAGKYMSSYDVDGKEYPCQFFMPLSIGMERAIEGKNIIFPDDHIPDEMLDNKCRDCIISSICPSCFGANYVATGNIYSRDNNMCRLNKIIIKARSYFKAKQWEMGQLKQSDEELQTLLHAIIKIQNELVI